ncbi:kinetochore-associated Ndc80 complex subunit ndc80 [Teratosphaeriaceae sp. CCFEE 6253]|nr:kinetochore-associated Ndc80 complex subunit ndc80 [Teratosphaeriaceae sp. CCFEE 6253]
MSQDPMSFSIRRPRETLGAVSHNVSAIPMPASAMKRSTSQSNLQAPHTTNHVRTTSGSHMSLAPNRPAQPVFQRSSSGTNLAEMAFSTVQRPSTANFLNSTGGGRKSYAPVASTPAHQQPLHLQESTTERRSSVYRARPSQGFGGPTGHQSFFATAPPQNGLPTDPRRLKDRTTTSTMGQELLEFLSQRNFEMEMKHTLSHKSVTNPIQKDFDSMFQFLYHCIDPSYRFQKKMDVEVPPLLKQLRYPFEKSISKSALGAVGGNTWSTFLGMLHWMMSLAKMMESYSKGVYDEACIEAGYDVAADRITFQFLSDAYKEWLGMDDDEEGDEEAQRRIQPHVEAMAAKFEQANEANLQQVAQLEAEGKALQEQIDELSKSAPRLAKLDETVKLLEEDRKKFEVYNANMEGKVEKYSHRADLLQAELEKCEQEIVAAEEERNDLQRRVDEQGLSVQDIDRMNSERERLQKGVEGTSVRLEEAKDRASKKEAETGGKLDELEAVVQRFNSLAYQVGVIPPSAPNANGADHELHLRLTPSPDFSASQSQRHSHDPSDRLLATPTAGYQPPALLPHDLRTLKHHLQDLRRTLSERRNASLEADLARLDCLDKTREALDDKDAELEGLGHRLRAAQEECEKTREILNAQYMAGEAQMERMEKELGRMRGGVRETVAEVEGREMEVHLEYEQLQLAASSLREGLHTQLERTLNEIIRFKIHVQGSLEQYEEFVGGEIEREVEEQQAQILRREEEAAQEGQGGVEGEGGADDQAGGWEGDSMEVDE